MKNYLPALHKSALIFASHSVWGGWHHVEVRGVGVRSALWGGFCILLRIRIRIRATQPTLPVLRPACGPLG